MVRDRMILYPFNTLMWDTSSPHINVVESHGYKMASQAYGQLVIYVYLPDKINHLRMFFHRTFNSQNKFSRKICKKLKPIKLKAIYSMNLKKDLDYFRT